MDSCTEEGNNMDRIEELRSEIEHRIMAKPETGEQWADICALEAEMCACMNALTSEKEQRDGVCRECL
jgi:hypothetical protein